MVFARIVHFYSPTRKVLIFSPSILALIFVTLDILSFIIQLVGGGMAGPGASPEAAKKGLDIYMGGIGMQEGFIALFLGLVVKFHLDQLQAERARRLAADKMSGWRWMVSALYFSLLAITVRIIYRLAEFSGGLGHSNALPSNEPLLYVLESAPMWLAVLVWNIIHPGRYIHGEDAKMPPSWLSRHFCWCRKPKHSHVERDVNQHLAHSNASLYDKGDQELRPIAQDHRGGDSSRPTNPFVDAPSREPSPDGHARV